MLKSRIAKLVKALSPKSHVSRLSSPESAFFESLEPRVLMAFDPSAAEQFSLELLNDMRMNPAAHLDRLVSSLNPLTSTNKNIQVALDFFKVNSAQLTKEWAALEAVAPLAWNEDLYDAAKIHNSLMIKFDTQSHQLPGEADLVSRIELQGYTPFKNLGENLFLFAEDLLSGHAGFAIDWGPTPTGIQTPPPHRDHMMAPEFKEVGIFIESESNPATTAGPLVITQEFGNRFSLTNPYLLGSVYNDTNSNGYYDVGEGLSGVTVTMKSATKTFTTTSMTAGGYQINAPAGTYDITYTGGKLAGTITRPGVVFTTNNIHINATLQELAPHIQVTGAGQKISNNDNTPSGTDGTLVTDAAPDAPTDYTFTIQNTGTKTLTLTSPALTSGAFKLTAAPTLSIAPGASTDFTVQFNPTVSGNFTSVFSVNTNDTSNATFKFTVGASVLIPEPDIAVTGKGLAISDGDSTPVADDGTLVTIPFNGPTGIASARTFEVTNNGASKLLITGSSLPANYSFETAPPAFLAAGDSVTLTVLFTPTLTGTYAGMMTLETNDPDTSAYNFTVSTKVVQTAPTITSIAALGAATAMLGTAFDVSAKLTNAGQVLANGAKVEFYLSKDATFSVTDIKLDTITSATKLLPTEELDVNGSFKAALTVVPGDYFLFAKVTSGAGVSVSTVSDTAISLTGVPKAPDLTITGSVTGTAFSQGDLIKAGFTAKNLGPGDVGASSVSFVLSQDKIFGNADDVFLTSIAVPGLKSGASFPQTGNMLTLPQVADGTWFLLSRVDPADLIAEKSETNNLFTSGALKIQKPVVGIKATTTKFSEAIGAGSFTVTRTGGSTLAPLSASFDITGAAGQNVDYKLMVDKTVFDSNTIVIPAGKSSVTVKVVGIDDSLVESTENIQISLVADPNVPSTYNVNPAQTNLAFTLEDNEPTLSIKAQQTKTTETKGSITFMVTRKSTSVAGPLEVFFDVTGTALAGTDYTFTSLDGKTIFTDSFIIPAKSASFSFKALVNDDIFVETTENATITLVGAPGVDPTYSLGTPISATFTIDDNEPSVSIKALQTKTSESKGSITYTVTRKTASLVNPLTVFFEASGNATNGVDYQFTSADGKTVLTDSFTIPAKAASFSFKAIVIDDSKVETAETVTVTLLGDPNADPAYSLGAPVVGSATIIDDEPTISVSAPATATKEGAVTASAITFSRSPAGVAAESKVTFRITGTAAFGDDYSLLSGTKGSVVTVEEIAGEVVGTITIPAKAASAILNLRASKDNDNAEPTESVIFTLDASPAYNVGAKSAATANITDVDVKLPIDVPVSPVLDLGARLTFSSAVSKTDKVNVGLPALATRTTVTGALFSTGNFIGTYRYETVNAGPDANKITFTAIIRAGTTPLDNVSLVLTFNSVAAKPTTLLGRQLSFYADGTGNTDGAFTVTGLPSDPGAVFTGTFAL
jgi:hypothetical protein